MELEVIVTFAGSQIKADSSVVWQFKVPATEIANAVKILQFLQERFTLFVMNVAGDSDEVKKMRVGRGFFGGLQFGADGESRFKIIMPLKDYKWRTEDLALLQDTAFTVRLVKKEL